MISVLSGPKNSCYPFPKQQILDSSKLKEFTDDIFKFDENGESFPKWMKNLWESEKLVVTSSGETLYQYTD